MACMDSCRLYNNIQSFRIVSRPQRCSYWIFEAIYNKTGHSNRITWACQTIYDYRIELTWFRPNLYGKAGADQARTSAGIVQVSVASPRAGIRLLKTAWGRE